MLRQNYLPVELEINEINILDLTKLNWNNFKFINTITKYKLTTFDIDKFYELTYKIYGSLVNEDFIYFVNKIDDPLNLQVGQEIIFPDIRDINSFLFSELNVRS